MQTSSSVFVISTLLLFWCADGDAEVEFGKAQVDFSNGKVLNVEIADTPETMRTGLMGRKRLGQDEGMLFVFPGERRMSFWMRDTFIPLSIAFFDKDKRLMSIIKMKPQVLMATKQDLRSYRSERPGLYALEVNQGWFEENSIGKGTTFELTGLK